jgi:hypothetical protein
MSAYFDLNNFLVVPPGHTRTATALTSMRFVQKWVSILTYTAAFIITNYGSEAPQLKNFLPIAKDKSIGSASVESQRNSR